MKKLTIAVLFVLAIGLTIVFGDDIYVEEASWFGKTGLSSDIEQELPRYLRREFGEPFFLPKSLKAKDLAYLGAFDEGAKHVHYWKIPYGKEDVYAYVVLRGNESSLGWGGRKPPGVATK